MNPSGGKSILLALVVIASVVAVGPATLIAEGASQSPTAIDSCTTIDSPGRYELTSAVDATNFTTDEARTTTCIEIRASDVVLDGNGHEVQGRTYRYSDSTGEYDLVGIGVPTDAAVSNLTIQNVDVDRARMWFTGVDGLSIDDVAVVGGGDSGAAIYVGSSADVSVVDTDAQGASYGVYLDDARNARIENGTFRGEGPGVNIRNTENASLANLTFTRVEALGSESVDIVDSDLRRVVTIRGSQDVLIANNDLVIVDITGGYTYSPPTAYEPEDVVVRDNVISPPPRWPYSYPEYTPTAVTIEAGVDASQVELRGNVFNSTEYGVRNEGEGYVDARRNYWGHPSGPSSPNRRVVLRDPITGALADGKGSAVSADPGTTNTSNVCFDPTKETPETGAENETESE